MARRAIGRWRQRSTRLSNSWSTLSFQAHAAPRRRMLKGTSTAARAEDGERVWRDRRDASRVGDADEVRNVESVKSRRAVETHKLGAYGIQAEGSLDTKPVVGSEYAGR